jgi:alpha-tubulin suppressor-like RCC1 family protein
VTETGKLYAIGNRFLKEISLDCDNKVIQVPLKEGTKAIKAYASMSHGQPLALLKVNAEGQEQLWSAGKNEQGLLGQGPGIKSSNVFNSLKYDSAAIKFKEISLHTDHAMALSESGELYAWGSNLNRRAGFKEDI